MRTIEILELGQTMRREARAGGSSVNDSYFIAHEIILGALRDDPALTGSDELHAQLSARLQRKLVQREIGKRTLPLGLDAYCGR